MPVSETLHVLQRVTWDELVSVRRFEAYSEELSASYPRHYPYKHGSTRHQQQQPSFHTSPTFDLWHVAKPAPQPQPSSTYSHLPLHQPSTQLTPQVYPRSIPPLATSTSPPPGPPPVTCDGDGLQPSPVSDRKPLSFECNHKIWNIFK